jgi:ABC-type branched-subunit amino acid transport system ATPase component
MTDILPQVRTADPDHLAAGAPLVLAQKVEKQFGQLKVLKGIDLAIPKGEVLCIIGPSGSGKSTFLRCINQLERIDGGALWVLGERVGYHREGNKLYELDDKAIARQRRSIGMVFQRFNLFPHLTALQNLSRLRKRHPGRRRFSNASGSPTSATPIRPSSPAASSSVSPSPVRSPCVPNCCSSTSRPRRWTRSWSPRC